MRTKKYCLLHVGLLILDNTYVYTEPCCFQVGDIKALHLLPQRIPGFAKIYYHAWYLVLMDC